MAQIMMRIMGKQAFNTPSTTDQQVMPMMLASANFSGRIPIAGTANRANKTVTMSVAMALL